MVQTSFDFPIPRDDDAFEIFCLSVLRRYLKTPMLQRHGRRGQKQSGVDLYGVSEDGVRFGAQCKARAVGRVVTVDELNLEVIKAKDFRPPLDRFLLATTAPRDAALQSHAAQLSTDHVRRGLFSVSIIAFEDLQDILRDDRELAAEVLDLRSLQTTVTIEQLHVHAAAGSSVPGSIAGIGLDQRNALDWIRSGQPEAAIDLLSRRKSELWGTLTRSDRTSLLVALGNAFLAAKRIPEASSHYFQASQIAADADGPKTLEALSFYLAGDLKLARRHALQALKLNAADGRAHMIRLRTEKATKQFSELVRQVPRPLRSHPEVALALYERAAQQSLSAKAEKIVRSALDCQVPWPPLSLALGAILVEEQVSKLRDSSDTAASVDSARLDEAISILSSVIESARHRDPDGILTEALVKRAVSYRLLGRNDASTTDLEAAFANSPKSAKVALLYAEVLVVERNQVDRAIEVLESARADDPTQAVDLYLSELLCRRGATPDLQRAASVLQAAMPFGSLEPEEARIEAALLGTELSLRLGTPDASEELNRRISELRLSAVSDALVAADYQQRRGNVAGARDLALAALANPEGGGPRSSRLRLARMLINFEDFSAAFAALKDLVGAESSPREKHELLHCARSCGEDRFVLEFCAQERRRGVLRAESLGHEVEVLLHYDEYRLAKKTLQEYLAVRPDDRVALVHLRWLAIRYKWDDALPGKNEALLSVSDLPSVSIGAEIVDILRHSGRLEDSLDYAYDLWRKFPQESLAHRALVTAVLSPGQHRLKLPEATRVAPGLAVSYRESDSTESRWIILETSESPRLELGEIPPSHELSLRLDGLAVGDSFEMPGTGVRKRTAVVESIVDRRVRRAQESMLMWQSRFPGEGFLEPIPVGGGSDQEQRQPDFSEIEKAARKLAERSDELEAVYADAQLPISTFALLKHKTVVETVEYLAVNPRTRVFAAPGGPGDLKRALSLLSGGGPIVLDPSAVASLMLVERFALLEYIGGAFLILESTLAELAELQNDPFFGQEERSFLGFRDGRLVLTRVEASDFEQRRMLLREVQDFLEQKGHIVGGSDLASFSVDLRSQLSDVLSPSSLQSMAVAATRGIPIWSDDRLAVDLARSLGMVENHVWTNAALLWWAKRGALSAELHALSAARLLKYGYTFTSINAQVVLAGLEALKWEFEGEDFGGLLREFSNPTWPSETAEGVLAETLVGIWKKAATAELARAVTRAILSAFSERHDHLAILQQIVDKVELALGLWPARSQDFRRFVGHYLKSGTFLL